jgi:hypothetical protein
MSLRAIVVLLVISAALPASAQVSVFAPNKIEVQMVARMQPGSAQVPSAVKVSGIGRVHRIVLDRSQRRYFAYDVLIEARDRSQALQVRFEPSGLSAPQLAEMPMVDASWKAVPLLKYPHVPDVRAGDTLAVDLLENPATGQKVVDYLVFKRANSTAAAETSPVQDLSLADVELQLEDFRVSVDGTVLDASTRFGGRISGGALWFYVPDRGRFVLSLLPNPDLGFRRAGVVTERSLTFTEGAERYSIQSASRIVPAGGRFHLYVLHDPDWRPTGDESDAPLVVGAAGRAQWLIGK